MHSKLLLISRTTPAGGRKFLWGYSLGKSIFFKKTDLLLQWFNHLFRTPQWPQLPRRRMMAIMQLILHMVQSYALSKKSFAVHNIQDIISGAMWALIIQTNMFPLDVRKLLYGLGKLYVYYNLIWNSTNNLFSMTMMLILIVWCP